MTNEKSRRAHFLGEQRSLRALRRDGFVCREGARISSRITPGLIASRSTSRIVSGTARYRMSPTCRPIAHASDRSSARYTTSASGRFSSCKGRDRRGRLRLRVIARHQPCAVTRWPTELPSRQAPILRRRPKGPMAPTPAIDGLSILRSSAASVSATTSQGAARAREAPRAMQHDGA